MATKIEKEDVRIILMEILNDSEHYGLEGKEAERHASYIAGVLDMANAVIQAIGKLGGK